MNANTQTTDGQVQERSADRDATVINLRLTAEENETLIPILDNYLADLRYEISDTDSSDFKHMLQRRKQLLTQVLEKLQQAAGADPGANI